MIIFLYGKDAFRLKQNLEKIVIEYQKKNPSGLSYQSFDVNETGLKPIIGNLKTISFFNEKRLLVLKNAFSQADLTGTIKTWDLMNDKSTIVVIVENLTKSELSKKNKTLFAQLIQKPNITKEYELLSPAALEKWVNQTAQTLNLKLDRPIITKLINYIGNDTWRLALELNKLANYSQNRPLQPNDLDNLIIPPINVNMFATLETLGNRQSLQTLLLLSKHLAAGDDPYYLFSMFVYQYRNLLRVKNLTERSPDALTGGLIAKKTGLHPFVASKLLAQAKKFTLPELKQKFKQLADSDLRIKSGQIDIVDCLYQLVTN